jgi:chemotaxis protein MotA
MFVLIGALVVLGSVVAGYTMHGGHLEILFQITEMIIIFGAALGSLLISNPLSVTKRVFKGAISTLKGSKVNRKAYEELLGVLYELLQLARKEGAVALERHFEQPAQSEIMKKAPTLLANHHALDFLCDTLRTLVSGNVEPNDLDDMMTEDLETLHHWEMQAPQALQNVGDSLPGLGIVAAVLGVVITMGKIDQPPAVIGHSVAAALVGTFLGILMCYGFIGPIAKNLEHAIHAEGRYMATIKSAVLAFAKGQAPAAVVEAARRAIDVDDRPTFQQLEKLLKKA